MSTSVMVIEYTNTYIKYGYSGYNSPEGKYMLGDNSPILNNIIINFDRMIDILKIIFGKCKMPQYMIIADPVYNNEDNKIKFANALTKNFNFKGVAYCSKHILALYGKSRNKGLVIEFCNNCTNIVPVYDSTIMIRGCIILPPRNVLTTLELYEGIGKSIMFSPIDIRKDLYKNILLIGENSNKINFVDKLIKKLKLFTNNKIIISNPNNKKNLTWIGGSIYGSMKSCDYKYGT